MIEDAMTKVPVLTEVVSPPLPAPPPSAAVAPARSLQDCLVQALPALVHETVVELQPQLEQQLLDALMPRLLAVMAQWQAEQREP